MGNSIRRGCGGGLSSWLLIYECTSNKLIWLRSCNYVSTKIKVQLYKLGLKCDFSIKKGWVMSNIINETHKNYIYIKKRTKNTMKTTYCTLTPHICPQCIVLFTFIPLHPLPWIGQRNIGHKNLDFNPLPPLWKWDMIIFF